MYGRQFRPYQMVGEIFIDAIVSESLLHLLVHRTLDVVVDFKRSLTGFVSLRGCIHMNMIMCSLAIAYGSHNGTLQ